MAMKKSCKFRNNKFCKCIDKNIIKRYKYSPRKDLYFYGSFFLLVVALIIFFFPLEPDAPILGGMSAFEAIVAVSAVAFAAFHLSNSKKISQAELIFEYNKGFLENKEFTETLAKIEKIRFFKDKEIKIEDIPLRHLANYLTYFEPLNLFLKKGVIPHYLIQDLFAYRFFIVFRCEEVKTRLYNPHTFGENWESFSNLKSLAGHWQGYLQWLLDCNKLKLNPELKKIYGLNE